MSMPHWLLWTLVALCYAGGLYGMIVITRMLHEIQRNTRRPERD